MMAHVWQYLTGLSGECCVSVSGAEEFLEDQETPKIPGGLRYPEAGQVRLRSLG